jgi:signal transduction histidine kinase
VLDEHAGTLEQDQRRVLEAAWRSSRRILRFAEDLRDLALAESGELPLDHGELDLAAVLSEAVARSWPVAAASRTPIDLDVEGAPRPVGDALQLGRAVDALVDHAVEHASAGTRIALHASEAGLTVDFETAGSQLDDPLGSRSPRRSPSSTTAGSSWSRATDG